MDELVEVTQETVKAALSVEFLNEEFEPSSLGDALDALGFNSREAENAAHIIIKAALSSIRHQRTRCDCGHKDCDYGCLHEMTQRAIEAGADHDR